MEYDISPLLSDWPLSADRPLTTRIIIGDDGRRKVQLRLPLGILQMETEGRPDGKRPHGYESLLHYYLDRAEQARGAGGELVLSERDAEELQLESLQYYHRRICYLDLEEWEPAEEDANHNLQIMDLLREHAADEDLWMQSEVYRPYVLSHRTHARAMWTLARYGRSYAIDELEKGMAAIREAYQAIGYEHEIEETEEIQSLVELRAEIERTAPLTVRDRLRLQLVAAVEREDYETAASLRDRLRELGIPSE